MFFGRLTDVGSHSDGSLRGWGLFQSWQETDWIKKRGAQLLYCVRFVCLKLKERRSGGGMARN